MENFIPDSENDINDTFIGASIVEPTIPKKIKKLKSRDFKDEWVSGGISLLNPSFIATSEMKISIPKNEFDFLKLFLTDYIIQYIVVETNKYALKCLDEENFKLFSLVTVDEMNMFICLIIYMGICDLPSYDMYWRKKENPFYCEYPSKIMSYERFCKIKKYFHVFDGDVFNDLESQSFSISKLDGLLDYFNKKFYHVYQPNKELSVDENMCPWSGSGGSKVYMPLKPIKYGMKLYALCESKSGYTCKLIIYNSKKTESIIEMLKRLTSNCHGFNHHLYMDNFYSSAYLFTEMSKFNIYCCGTLRDNRGGPRDFKKTIYKLKIGEGYIFNNGNLNCLGMKDNGAVAILTNIHSASSENKMLIKNLNDTCIVKDYNNFMGGVDLLDQMTKYYGLSRRSKKWTSKLCLHILNIAFYNSYIMYKKFCKTNQKKTYLKYLIKIMNKLSNIKNSDMLFRNETINKLENVRSNIQFHETIPNLVATGNNVIIEHFPYKLLLRKRCVVCLGHGIRKDVFYCCKKCNVPLCIDQCFERWHNG